MLDQEGQGLREELLELMEGGAEQPLDDLAFDTLARRVFAHNFHRVPAYGAYCRARGVDPKTVRSWLDIPAVPTAAFKEVSLVAAGGTVERTFRTSGTTRGPERRGEHHVVDLSLYLASLRPTFQAFLLPDRPRLRFLSLVAEPAVSPDSSLAFMVHDVLRTFGADGSATFADGQGIDLAALDRAIETAALENQPVLLLGTSAALIHWLDHLAARDARYALPAGSRLMDTGGFKGGGRVVAPDELRHTYYERLRLSSAFCVNEYGMTEMLSQLYDSSLRDTVAGRAMPSRKQGPPWLRSVAVDPETLAPLPPGRPGILRHLDLANLGSVAAIQTEDLGVVDEHGLVLEGRIPGAEPRGCSIAMDLLLGGKG